MKDPIVSIRGVSKKFPGGVIAVDNVNIDIGQNEFFALLGPVGLWQNHFAPHDFRFGNTN